MLTLPIAKPPWMKLGRKLESKVRKALYEYQLVDGVKHLGIALSGGKDSLTLLYMLAAIRGQGAPDFKITAFHVTGDFSCGASIQPPFLKPICKELEVKLVVLNQAATSDKTSCYPCSRERRKLIFDAAKKNGVETIAFGHHRDDSAQTLLMNLFHKGEFAANLAKIHMKNYGITIVRPLIFISEQEIIDFSKTYNFNRVVCRCPIGQDSMRKKTDDLLRYIEKIFPEARSNLASAGRVYGSDKANRP
ncbi:MAG: tRNA-cytidine(32) 2-sulfurtransferase [Chlamydiae bacterium]|nr:tRNA-cytidine(32) 2-sulfurtransferase [Chlamydiota bacterium]